MTPPLQLVPRLCDLRLRSVVAVAPDTTIRKVAQAMRAHGIGSLVVAMPGERVSIVTERDLTAVLADGIDPQAPVSAVASPNPVTAPADATAMDAATLMLRDGIRHLVVTRDGRAVGVASMGDLLAVLVQTVTPETVFLLVQRAALSLPA